MSLHMYMEAHFYVHIAQLCTRLLEVSWVGYAHSGGGMGVFFYTFSSENLAPA